MKLACLPCNPIARPWLTLSGLLLLAGCATPLGVVEQNYELLAPATIKQSVTILLIIDRNQAETLHSWEAVLNIDAQNIDLIILSTLGRRLATLTFDGQKVTVEKNNAVDIPLKNLLRQLQMIYWPLAELNSGKWNKNWYFEQQNQIRYIYFRQQLVAEIHRRPSSLWSGDFEFISKISDDHLRIRSSKLEH